MSDFMETCAFDYFSLLNGMQHTISLARYDRVLTRCRPISPTQLQHLRGRRGRREAPEDIQFIDVNQDDILPDRDEWMTKQLTEEKVVRRPQKSADDPTSQQRRKHQITYLAHQVRYLLLQNADISYCLEKENLRMVYLQAMKV